MVYAFIMNEVEKRRIQLLQDTRKNYSDKNTPPAIHPRFQSAYRSLYQDEEQNHFFTRIILAVLVLGICFVLQQDEQQTLINIIQDDLFSEFFPLLVEFF